MPPAFTPAAGVLLAATDVSLETETAGADIYYMFVTDGSVPTNAEVKNNGTAYTEPVNVTEAGILYAVAESEGKLSIIASAAYTFPSDIADGLVNGATVYTVSSVAGLQELSTIVNGGQNLAGVTIIQTADITINNTIYR